MQEVSADVGDARVLSSQPSDGFGTVSGTALGARDGLRAPLYSAEPARQRLRGMEPADLETVGGCGNSKGGKAAVDPPRSRYRHLWTRDTAAQLTAL